MQYSLPPPLSLIHISHFNALWYLPVRPEVSAIICAEENRLLCWSGLGKMLTPRKGQRSFGLWISS